MDTRTNTITSLYTKLLAALDTAQSQSPSPVVQGCQIFCHGESWLASLTGAELLEIQRAVTYQLIENEGRAPRATQPQEPQAQEPQPQEPQEPQPQEPPSVEALCEQADAIMAKPVYQEPKAIMAKPVYQEPKAAKAKAPAKPKAPTIADLKALCKHHGIKGYSRLSKGDLILKLREYGIETI